MPDVINETVVKICSKHGESNFSVAKDGRARCRKCAIDAVAKRRKIVKLKALDYKGGKCEYCGYCRCIEALEFHHTVPGQKDFAISSSGHTRSWNKMKAELDKCELLCANCHREAHLKIRSADISREI